MSMAFQLKIGSSLLLLALIGFLLESAWFVITRSKRSFCRYPDRLLIWTLGGYVIQCLWGQLWVLSGFPIRTWQTILLIAVLLPFVPWARLMKKHVCGDLGKILRLWPILAFIPVYVVVSQQASYPIVNWDAMWIWSHKATVLLHSSIVETSYFWEPRYGITHQAYPLGFPVMIATMQTIFGGLGGDGCFKLINVDMWIMLILVCYCLSYRQVGGMIAAILSLWIGSLPHVVEQAGLNRPDITVGVLSGFALFLAFRSGLKAEGFYAFLLALTLAVLATTKNEGSALSLVIGLIYSVSLLCFNGLSYVRRLVGYSGLYALCIAPWLLFSRYLPHVDENYPSRMVSASLMETVKGIWESARFLITYLSDLPEWRCFFILAVTAGMFLLMRWDRLSRMSRLHIMISALTALVYVAIILVIFSLADLGTRRVSVNRIAFTFIPLCVPLLSLGLRSIMETDWRWLKRGSLSQEPCK